MKDNAGNDGNDESNGDQSEVKGNHAQMLGKP